jgi:hypothetical protein
LTVLADREDSLLDARMMAMTLRLTDEQTEALRRRAEATRKPTSSRRPGPV